MRDFFSRLFFCLDISVFLLDEKLLLILNSFEKMSKINSFHSFMDCLSSSWVVNAPLRVLYILNLKS